MTSLTICILRHVLWQGQESFPLKKVKGSPYNRPLQALRMSKGIAYPFMTSALRCGWVVSTTPRPLYPRKRPGTHCTGGWVGPRAGLDGCGKSRPHRDSIPGPSVATPTTLSRPSQESRPNLVRTQGHIHWVALQGRKADCVCR